MAEQNVFKTFMSKVWRDLIDRLIDIGKIKDVPDKYKHRFIDMKRAHLDPFKAESGSLKEGDIISLNGQTGEIGKNPPE